AAAHGVVPHDPGLIPVGPHDFQGVVQRRVAGADVAGQVHAWPPSLATASWPGCSPGAAAAASCFCAGGVSGAWLATLAGSSALPVPMGAGAGGGLTLR